MLNGFFFQKSDGQSQTYELVFLGKRAKNMRKKNVFIFPSNFHFAFAHHQSLLLLILP
jgi:hypothetical protein